MKERKEERKKESMGWWPTSTLHFSYLSKAADASVSVLLLLSKSDCSDALDSSSRATAARANFSFDSVFSGNSSGVSLGQAVFKAVGQ